MSQRKKNALCLGVQFCSGGIGYGVLEILWRGYTHASMLVLGGVCFCIFIRLSKSRFGLLVQCILAGLWVTVLEFGVGCVVNLWLGLGVWDYSQEFGQVMGQVCLRFFLLWCSLASIILPLCQGARRLWGKWREREALPALSGEGEKAA